MTEAEVGGMWLMAGGHEPRIVGTLQELEKAGRCILPQGPQKEHSPEGPSPPEIEDNKLVLF